MIIGAGNVVTKDIPSNSVAVGNPARVICSVDAYIEKEKAKMNEHNTYKGLWYEQYPEECKEAV